MIQHGLCYTFNANISTVYRVGSGRRQGLVIHFDVQPEEYYGPFSYDASGLKIAIHEPGEYHDIEKDGYEVSPGFYSSLRLKRFKVREKQNKTKTKQVKKQSKTKQKY